MRAAGASVDAMTTTTSLPPTTTGSPIGRWRRLLMAATRRWPTALALAMSALSWGGGLGDYPLILPLLPMAYAVVLALGRRWLTWPVVVLSVALLGPLLDQTAVDPQAVLLVVAAAALGASLLHSHRGPGHGHGGPRGRREVLLQGAGLVVFGGLAVLGAHTAPQVAVWVVAAGWFGHGVWDAVHLYRDAVVSRTFAEWCAVVDVLVAVGLVLGATSWAS